MRMVNPRLTDNVIAGLRHSFTFVAKKHLHSSLAYWLLGLTVAFASTMIYISSEQGTFLFSNAETTETLTELVSSEELLTSDYYLAVASGEKTNLIRWDPEYTRIPKDSNLSAIMLAATMLVAIVAPVALPALGLEGIGASITSGISSVTGMSIETVTAVMNIVRGASTLNTVAGAVASGVNYTIPAALGWGSFVATGNPGAKILPASTVARSTGASTSTSPTTKKASRGVTVPDMNSVKIGNRAVAEINKRTSANIKKLNGLVCGVPVKNLVRDNDDRINVEQLFTQLQGLSTEKINDFKGARINGRKNEVRAIYTIAAISGATLEAMKEMEKLLFSPKIMKQRCPVYEGDRHVTDPIAPAKSSMAAQDAMRQIRAIVENESAVAGKTAREVYENSDKRTAVEFERVGVKDAVILSGIEGEPLPNSSWVGFKNGDVHGKAAPDNTLMMAVDSFTLSTMPVRAFIGIRSTDIPVELKLNGVPVNTLKQKVNSKDKAPHKTFVYELKDVVGIGINRLSVTAAQSAGSRAKFALNYALYVVCEPGVQCVLQGE